MRRNLIAMTNTVARCNENVEKNDRNGGWTVDADMQLFFALIMYWYRVA